MEKNSIRPGEHYAIREHPGDELQHVHVLEPVRSGKWRAEWIDPNPGLVDYVASRHIIVPWGQRRGFLRGERHPLTVAVDTVLDATGEPTVIVHRGVLHYEQDALERIAARAAVYRRAGTRMVQPIP